MRKLLAMKLFKFVLSGSRRVASALASRYLAFCLLLVAFVSLVTPVMAQTTTAMEDIEATATTSTTLLSTILKAVAVTVGFFILVRIVKMVARK